MKSTPKNRQAALSAFPKPVAGENLQVWIAACCKYLEDHGQTIREALQAQSTDALRSALKFYANPESYELTDMDDMGTCASPIDLDGGDRAIKALEPAGKEGEE